MLEALIILAAFISLVGIYVVYVVINTIQLKTNILSQAKTLQLQLRKQVDLLHFSNEFPAFKAIRSKFIKSQDINFRMEIYSKVKPILSSTSHQSFPHLYLESLSTVHMFNNSYFSIKKLKKKLVYRLIFKLIYPEFSSLKPLSSS